MAKSKKPSKARLAKIRMIIFDFDGVLTDNYVMIGESGERFKRFWVPDGVGIFTAHLEGIKFAIVTGNGDRTTKVRAEFLRIDEVFQEVRDKSVPYEAIKRKYDLTDSECLFIGDDMPDLPIFERVGIGVAPCDATPAIRRMADWVGKSPGGRGIVREAIDAVLAARGFKWIPKAKDKK
jgi:3-deoxy-D-manno-octulosonate 8-phosphate phosphatase (KDO 8-P phosphatase)